MLRGGIYPPLLFMKSFQLVSTAHSGISGIYMLLNLSNNKFYIGSSSNVRKRVLSHFNELKKNSHRNSYLQRAYNKYVKYFVAVFIEEVSNDDLLIREQYWIDSLNACRDGYNLSPTAGSTRGVKVSDETKNLLSKLNRGVNNPHFGKPRSVETKRLLSEKHKGKVLSQKTRNKISSSRSKKIVQLDLSGNFIRYWDSGKQAAEVLSIEQACISSCCRRKTKYYYNSLWLFANDYENFQNDLSCLIPNKAKRIEQRSVNGTFLRVWNSYDEIKDSINKVNITHIIACCDGKRMTHKGYKWSYAL